MTRISPSDAFEGHTHVHTSRRRRFRCSRQVLRTPGPLPGGRGATGDRPHADRHRDGPLKPVAVRGKPPRVSPHGFSAGAGEDRPAGAEHASGPPKVGRNYVVFSKPLLTRFTLEWLLSPSLLSSTVAYGRALAPQLAKQSDVS